VTAPRKAPVEESVDGSRLLEREGELDALTSAFHDARRGAGGLLVLEGHAGVGKSSLLAEAKSAAQALGLGTLTARGSQLERELTFGVVVQLFESVLVRCTSADRDELLSGAAALARPLLEPEGSLPPTEDREFAYLHGLHWLCANLSERQPLALLVDDAHWADCLSLRFLLYLRERLDELPVVAVVALRPNEPGSAADLLLELSRHPAARTLNLNALHQTSVERLVRDRLPTAEDDFCRACETATGGNPFLLRELLAAVERAGIEPNAAEAGRVARLAPDTVLRATMARLAHLSAEARALVRAVAILGDGATFGQAAALAELTHEEMAHAADALAAIEILRLSDFLGFVHPLLRSSIEADVPPQERALLHLQAARLLAKTISPERIASHLLLAPSTADDWVVDSLRKASRHALAAAAPGTAVLYLRRALMEPPADEQRAVLLAELGEAEALAGEASAVERLDEALALMDDPRDRARTLLRLGWMLHKSGKLVESAAIFRQGLTEVTGQDEQLEQALTIGYLGVAWLDKTLTPDLAHQRNALIEGHRRAGSPAERGVVAQILLQKIFAGEPHEEIRDLGERVLDEGRLIEEEGSDSFTLWIAIGALSWADELDLAEASIEAALHDAQRRGAFVNTALAIYSRSWPRLWRGRVSDAAADAQAAVDAWSGGWGMYLPAAKYWLACALLERDELDAAEAALELDDDERWRASAMYAIWLVGRGRVAMAKGKTEVAWGEFRSAGELIVEGLRVSNPAVIPWRSEAALAAAGVGEIAEARRLATEEVSLARRFGAARPLGVALRAAGLVERDETGIDSLRESVQTLESSPSQLEYARSLIDLGAALRRHGKRMDARGPLREGLSMVERFGARRLERQARAELEATGARLRREAISGVGSLTPGERRVAEMAASGMSNREIAQALFVTVKAVKFHLHNAYGKLDVASREELPAALEQ
jgi:DNA-binding CsgD family transcriptional regulator